MSAGKFSVVRDQFSGRRLKETLGRRLRRGLGAIRERLFSHSHLAESQRAVDRAACCFNSWRHYHFAGLRSYGAAWEGG